LKRRDKEKKYRGGGKTLIRIGDRDSQTGEKKGQLQCPAGRTRKKGKNRAELGFLRERTSCNRQKGPKKGLYKSINQEGSCDGYEPTKKVFGLSRGGRENTTEKGKLRKGIAFVRQQSLLALQAKKHSVSRGGYSISGRKRKGGNEWDSDSCHRMR